MFQLIKESPYFRKSQFKPLTLLKSLCKNSSSAFYSTHLWRCHFFRFLWLQNIFLENIYENFGKLNEKIENVQWENPGNRMLYDDIIFQFVILHTEVSLSFFPFSCHLLPVFHLVLFFFAFASHHKSTWMPSPSKYIPRLDLIEMYLLTFFSPKLVSIGFIWNCWRKWVE